jgi:hypothetical protein
MLQRRVRRRKKCKIKRKKLKHPGKKKEKKGIGGKDII